MEEKNIKKLISIGANCIGADFSKSLGIREKGPVDNIAHFNIWKSFSLFDDTFKKYIFKSKYLIRDSSDIEINKYNFYKKKFIFDSGIMIVHNNFKSYKFKKSLRKRIRVFKRYYKRSLKDKTLWYLYSLEISDELLDINRIKQIKESLPPSCTERMIVLGIRAHNKRFRDVFNYYFELEDETQYKWTDKSQAFSIMKSLESEYKINFVLDDVKK